MSLGHHARERRNIELRARENEIVALYRQLKTDEEIAKELHLDVSSVRLARDSMYLPHLRTREGRLWTPEIDQQLMDMRDTQGQGFKAIAQVVGSTEHEAEVRYRCLARLQERKEASKYAAVIPCMLCRREFWSEDKRRIRFCKLCRSGPVHNADSGPFER